MLLLLVCLPSLLSALDCSSPKDVGESCDTAGGRMFYFDPRYKVCQPFTYLGCGGNENKFATAAECKAACTGAPKPTTTNSGAKSSSTSSINNFVPQGNSHDQWRKADLCGSNYLIPNGKYTLCDNGSCPKDHSCVQGACCPSKDYVCSLRDDNGRFEDGVEDRPRFSYNQALKTCERFSYYGASGNYNNFPNFYSCLNYCKDSKKIDV